ncbi:MAG: 30S ribosomal protein S18 [Elusimicrobia bacterium]|nr:30S ribosomal protein S18 [Elusimicrobiota bacterium]
MAEQEAPSSPAPAVPATSSAPASSHGPRRRGAFAARRKVCRFCAEQIREVDWKQFQILRTFTTERGRILSGRVTGTCAKHQRQLARAVKRARFIALLPYVAN